VIYERSLNRRRGESQTRPSPIHGNGSVRRPPTRTLCHGWSEPGAAVKWHKPEFCTEPGPSGPEGINIWNRILCAENFAEGRRGIPRKRGSGGGATMGGDAHRSPPPGGVLVPFLPEKKELAQRAKPSAWNKTIPNIGGRVRRPAPTTFQADHSRTGKREGQAPPLRDGGEVFCARGRKKHNTPPDPDKKGHGGA
jgi:hypothetical protein